MAFRGAGQDIYIEKLFFRLNSGLRKELSGLPVTKTAIHRNVDRKAWRKIVMNNLAVRAVIVALLQAGSRPNLLL